MSRTPEKPPWEEAADAYRRNRGERYAEKMDAAFGEYDPDADDSGEVAHHPPASTSPEQVALPGLCSRCGGTRSIADPETGWLLRCPDCALPDPDRNTVGQAHAPWRGAPDTERQAATLQAVKSGTDRRRVLDYIGRCGHQGATDEEIALGLEMRHYTAAPRRTELRDGGWVEDSGVRRATTTGSAAAVWVLTERGRQEWRPEQSDRH